MPSHLEGIKATWPDLGASVTIALLDDKAPRICAALRAALPFSSIQGHAFITGDMMFAITPVSRRVRENVTLFTQVPIGACYYSGGSQNFGFVYGPVSEPEGFSICGQVIETDIPVLERVGEAVWNNLMRPWSPDPSARNGRKNLLVDFTATEVPA